MAYRDVTSLRSQVRVALLALFAAGSYGTPEEVEEYILADSGRGKKRQRFRAGETNLSVQVAQVRNTLLDELKIDRPSGRGRMSKEEIAHIERKLKLKSTVDRLAKLQKVDAEQLAEAA